MSQVKQITVKQGDDLRIIASRELGNASRWTELVVINDLRLPFVVASYKAEDRLPHTVIWGDTLLVPWDTNAERVPTPISNYGTDIKLTAGSLVATASGDLAVVSGKDNIVQSLSNRIKTLRGEMVYYPTYGCSAQLALGMKAKPFIELMGSAWVTEALKEEPRLASVDTVESTVSGDALRISAKVTAVGNNTSIDLNLVLNP